MLANLADSTLLQFKGEICHSEYILFPCEVKIDRMIDWQMFSTSLMVLFIILPPYCFFHLCLSLAKSSCPSSPPLNNLFYFSLVPSLLPFPLRDAVSLSLYPICSPLPASVSCSQSFSCFSISPSFFFPSLAVYSFLPHQSIVPPNISFNLITPPLLFSPLPCAFLSHPCRNLHIKFLLFFFQSTAYPPSFTQLSVVCAAMLILDVLSPLLLLSILLPGYGCHAADIPEDTTSEFSVRLYHRLQAAGGQDNIIFSPLSVAVALGMVELGARGASLEEIRQAVGFSHLLPGERRVSKHLFTDIKVSIKRRQMSLWQQKCKCISL